MSKGKQANTVVMKDDGKYTWIYIKNVPLFYAAVHKPVMKQKGQTLPPKEQNEFKVTVFATREQVDQLNDFPVNKTFAEVDVDKITKGKNRGNIKFPSDKFEGVEGRFGFQISVPEYSKKGNKQSIIVLDKEGKPLTDAIGNGSVGTVRCMAWKNEDEEWNLRLNLVHVTDLVPYEQGPVTDDELGITYEMPSRTKEEEGFSNDPELDDDAPFPTDEEDDDNY